VQVTAADLAYIRQEAIRLHMDPNAVFAIAGHEGLSGGVGDGGHAFGPFQMNDAGGVLTNAPANQHNNAWAWSHQGINTALSEMAKVAAGLHGRAAVTAIATKYERPANPGAEISDAMAHYGKVGMGGASTPPGVQNVGQKGGTTTQFDAATYSKQAAALMMQSQAAANGQGPAPPGGLLMQMAQAKKAATMQVTNGGGIHGQGTPQVAGSTVGAKAVSIASRQIGIPYVWGGTTRKGFDCSGLTQFVYNKLGISIPRLAADQGKAGHAVNYTGAGGNLRPGDLLVEKNGDHVVMYAGQGMVIAADHTGTNVRRDPISYFPSSQYNARRIIGQ